MPISYTSASERYAPIILDIERWSGPDVDRIDRAKEVLGGRVSVGYVEDDSFLAIIGEARYGMSDHEPCQPLFLVRGESHHITDERPALRHRNQDCGDDLPFVFHDVGSVEQRIVIIEERLDLFHGVIEVFAPIIDGATYASSMSLARPARSAGTTVLMWGPSAGGVGTKFDISISYRSFSDTWAAYLMTLLD